MTENEAIENLKFFITKLCNGIFGEKIECFRVAIVALEEIQKYRLIEKRLMDMFGGQLSLEHYVDRLEEALKEPGKAHPVNARILTYEDADMWEAYKSLGTAEECRAAVEKQKAKRPKEFEDKFYACPMCGGVLMHKWEKYPTKRMPKENGLPYCLGCGQRLDWSGEDE